MLDKERKEKKCLHNIAAHEELSFAIFCLGSFPFCRYVAHNLESFLVSLVDVSQNSQKNNRNKTDTCLEGWGRVGDTHFADSHIGGIHISLVILACVASVSVWCRSKKDRGTGFSVLATREMKQEPPLGLDEGDVS